MIPIANKIIPKKIEKNMFYPSNLTFCFFKLTSINSSYNSNQVISPKYS